MKRLTPIERKVRALETQLRKNDVELRRIERRKVTLARKSARVVQQIETIAPMRGLFR